MKNEQAKKYWDCERCYFLFKVLLVGPRFCGKLEILRRIPFPDADAIPTIGVDFKIWKTEVDGNRVKLQIWDTSGQEKFHNITNTYLRGTKGILYVYNVSDRESFNTVKEYIQQTQESLHMFSNYDSVSEMLVGFNKSSASSNYEVSLEEGISLARDKKMVFITIDDSNDSVVRAFTRLARQMIKVSKLNIEYGEIRIGLRRDEEQKYGFSIIKGKDTWKIGRDKERTKETRSLDRGIYVSWVVPDSPAEKANLKVGDRIMNFDGLSFKDISFKDAEFYLDIGETYNTIVIFREQEVEKLRHKLLRLWLYYPRKCEVCKSQTKDTEKPFVCQSKDYNGEFRENKYCIDDYKILKFPCERKTSILLGSNLKDTEKPYVCQTCDFTCHVLCFERIKTACTGQKQISGQQSLMLNAFPSLKDYLASQFDSLLVKGWYESYDMRIMVVGQFDVGKTTLVKVLIGDKIPEGRRTTDGITLFEGRCGLDIEERKWICMPRGNQRDILYSKILTSPGHKPTENPISETTFTVNEGVDELDSSSYIHTDVHDERLKVTSSMDNNSDSNHEKIVFKQFEKVEYQAKTAENVLLWKCNKIKPKITKKLMKKQMADALKKGTYKVRIGRLVFWDFGGQYIYYTTHQTFMTYRALFTIVFDGTKGLHNIMDDITCFPGQHGNPTPALFLQHWVNSILTYCKHIETGYPQILFVATHKDEIPENLVEETRKTLYEGVEHIFKDHEGYKHLVLEHRLFVNATDPHDPELETLKKVITDLTFSHPCWGEKIPNAWVPLELEISNLVSEGKNLLSLAELKALNQASEVTVLTGGQLDVFLKVKHSLGSIVYFDIPHLREYVIINPLYMVDVMRSFVTDEQFWPADKRLKDTFQGMTKHGIIQKSDLFSIWKRREFSNIWPYREFIFDMLIHLDILSEQRRYDRETGSRLPVKDYFVPCMLTARNESNYFQKECTSNKSMCLAFTFKGTVIPPALPNRLISTCLSIWTLKEYNGQKLLFPGFVALAVDKSHDLIVCVQDNKILVYIVHKRTRDLIMPDVALSVRECLYTTLQRISEFYQSTIEDKSSQKLPFHIEFACSEMTCFIPEKDALEMDCWICPCHLYKHGRHFWNVWISNRFNEECDRDCPGLTEDALCQHPSDSELRRISVQFDPSVMYELAIHLGTTIKEWKTVRYDHPENIEDVMFLVLWKWKETTKETFRELSQAVVRVQHNTHKLCMVRKIRKIETCIPDEILDAYPTDEILDALAPLVGLKSFHLGIELGLNVELLQTIQYNHRGDLTSQIREILYIWRSDDSVKPTIATLAQALTNIEKGTRCLENIIDNVGVKYESRDQTDTVKDGDQNKIKRFFKRLHINL